MIKNSHLGSLVTAVSFGIGLMPVSALVQGDDKGLSRFR